MKLKCPICGLDAEVPDDALPGEIVEHDCGAILEVCMDGESPKLKPLEVKEDWGE